MSTAVAAPNSQPSTPLEIAAHEEGDHVIYRFGTKTFRLDKEKARARLAGKSVINGHRSAELNVLP